MRLRPSFYLIADTHFRHDAIVHLGGRPKDFDELIIKNWNRVVTKKDKVLHLGDLALSNKEKAMEICLRLNGIKYLIRGNHDGHSDTWYRDCGFSVLDSIYKVFKDKYDNRYPILFTHEPVQDLPKGWFNIHGHMHEGKHREFDWKTARHYDVGVDSNNFELVPLYKLLKLFEKI